MSFIRPRLSQRGGALEMAQLWVNLPAAQKMSPPRYQGIHGKEIPQVTLERGPGSLRVIAGNFAGVTGPAATHSASMCGMRSCMPAMRSRYRCRRATSAAIAVLHGAIVANASRTVGDAELVLLDRGGQDVRIKAAADTAMVVLSGALIAEPIVGYGPFVMNSRQEIETAMNDFRSGRFGRMPAPAEQRAAAAGP